jgi:hypothetical protein
VPEKNAKRGHENLSKLTKEFKCIKKNHNDVNLSIKQAPQKYKTAPEHVIL